MPEYICMYIHICMCICMCVCMYVYLQMDTWIELIGLLKRLFSRRKTSKSENKKYKQILLKNSCCSQPTLEVLYSMGYNLFFLWGSWGMTASVFTGREVSEGKEGGKEVGSIVKPNETPGAPGSAFLWDVGGAWLWSNSSWHCSVYTDTQTWNPANHSSPCPQSNHRHFRV